MTPENLSVLSGVLLSLAASYMPKFDDWYAALDGLRKRQVMAGLLALSAVGVVASQCASDWSCYPANAEPALRAFFTALVINQATFLITKRRA